MISDEDAEKIAARVADDLRCGFLEENQRWFLAQQKNKFEIVFGIDCEREEQRRRMRKIVEFGDKSLAWFESDEGQSSMAALANMSKMLGTEEGARQIETLREFAAIMDSTQHWVKGGIAKAFAVGLLAIIFIGLQSSDALRDAWWKVAKFFWPH